MIDTATSHASGRRATKPTSRWDYAGYLGRHSAVVQSRNLTLVLYARAFMWFHKIADFRAAESHLLYERAPDKKIRAQHKEIISLLISEGREIIRRIRANGGLIKPANGFSLQDIQSAVAALENTKLQWTGILTSARKEEILKGVFHAA